ncbi:MAG TPA: hypothetical protein VM432_00055 [Bdellovibrionales bacterium]|nr:hypothetical protein [Bdellovibrionales bacterium]
MNPWRTVAIVLCVASLASCAKEEGAEEQQPRVESRSDKKLQGQWVSSCADAMMFGNSQRSEIKISEDSIIRTTFVSTSGNCGDTSVEVLQVGSLELGETNRLGARKVDIGVRTVSVRPVSELGVSILNAGTGFCGYKNWRVGVEKNVTRATGNERCYEKTPKLFYDIYSLEDDKLFFGEGEAARDESLRPAVIDRNDVYSRK